MGLEQYGVSTLGKNVGVVLLAVEPQDKGRFLLKFQNTVEIEDEKKPALIAETLALLLAGS